MNKLICALLSVAGAFALAANGSAAEKPDTDKVKVEFSPIIDANGLPIDWTAEHDDEVLALDATERAYRVNNPDGTATVFTIQELPEQRAICVRVIIKSGPPLRAVLPEGLMLDIPAGTVARFFFTLNMLGMVGGAPSSNSNRDIYMHRAVTGYLSVLVEVGGPISVHDANDGTFRSVTLGERVTFDIRNFFVPRYMIPPYDRTDPRNLGVATFKEKKKKDRPDDPDEPDVITPPGP